MMSSRYHGLAGARAERLADRYVCCVCCKGTGVLMGRMRANCWKLRNGGYVVGVWGDGWDGWRN